MTTPTTIAGYPARTTDNQPVLLPQVRAERARRAGVAHKLEILQAGFDGEAAALTVRRLRVPPPKPSPGFALGLIAALPFSAAFWLLLIDWIAG